jgi:tRNA (guanine37-N1)-methyltransferase
MRIDIVTLFPGMFSAALGESIVGRARERGLVEIGFVNPRDFSKDKHRRVDDRPYGGGAGMVLMAEPLAAAIKSVKKRGSRVVFLSPQGKRFAQDDARRLSSLKHVVLVCGHYEGIDERAMSLFDEELSIGDFVLTGGELPAMVVADALVRLVPGVLKKDDAAAKESFSEEGLLDFPQYTRPRVWRRKRVPEVLFSGDHARIAAWRSREAEAATRRKRPDLLETNTGQRKRA